jgi:succinylglutamate desuccinylase
MQISKDSKVDGVVHISASGKGPRAVMFCGVHGDEVSGVHAIEKLFFDFFGGKRELLQGSLTLARANEHALAAERRYIKYNLNRMFRDQYGADIDQSSYEYRRTQELKPFIEACDYFLDFHSAPIAQEPFLVAEQKAVKFFSKLRIPKIMTGWGKFSSGAIGGDTENYANAHGAISATLESGSHFEKKSNDVAYHAAISFLGALQMIAEHDASAALPKFAPGVELFDVYKVVLKEFDDFQYSGEARNFKFLKRGEPFAIQSSGPMLVTEDSYLLIPMRPSDTKVGEEVCYLGRKIAIPSS